jgi:hypothetical protein
MSRYFPVRPDNSHEERWTAFPVRLSGDGDALTWRDLRASTSKIRPPAQDRQTGQEMAGEAHRAQRRAFFGNSAEYPVDHVV